ncbi:hypothetical protein NLJ89_g4265 [Agrocybe chaxingu]|uniref:Uncharacterized protein n=1 Tax=Agrocybe chaxingu TaxID=84603 RepID=A0A9W8K8Y0_9AGAR|nr:hypothetical protein NLJ89_g4265 [Agrocybe chaxingu]
MSPVTGFDDTTVYLHVWTESAKDKNWNHVKAREDFLRAFQALTLVNEMHASWKDRAKTVFLVATRANEMKCDEDHYTAHIFDSQGEYLGSVHAFPDYVQGVPSFCHCDLKKKKRWSNTNLKDLWINGMIMEF